MDLWNVKNIKYLLNKYNYNFSKALGQNFLINRNICPKIADMGNINSNYGVIEIGPGIGVLTVELAKKSAKVATIEIDAKLIPILGETLLNYNNVKVINADVLQVDLKELIKKEFAGLRVSVCANLPYYITSSIIMYILESRLPIDSITVMVQKEAAQRICALPGTRDVGALSIAVRYYSKPTILFNVSRNNFMPSPDVDSSVIRLDIREKPSIDLKSEKEFFKVVKAAFSQRRKTILNAISNGVGIPKDQTLSILNECSIDTKSRAENLTLEDFGNISNRLFLYSKERNMKC